MTCCQACLADSSQYAGSTMTAAAGSTIHPALGRTGRGIKCRKEPPMNKLLSGIAAAALCLPSWRAAPRRAATAAAPPAAEVRAAHPALRPHFKFGRIERQATNKAWAALAQCLLPRGLRRTLRPGRSAYRRVSKQLRLGRRRHARLADLPPVRPAVPRRRRGRPGTGFMPTPYWPSDTQQFGVYYIRGPW